MRFFLASFQAMSLSLRLLRSLGKSYMAASSSLRGETPAAMAAATVRYNSSDDSTKSHAITGGSYDGPGKTTVSILNQDMPLLMLDSYSAVGFRLNNGMRVFGPVAVFPTCVLSWLVPSGAEGITRDSLSLFTLIHPRPEIVYVGFGDSSKKYDIKLAIELKNSGHNFQFMPTEHAISAYNFMTAEGRVVAAALIPPESMKMVTADDEFGTAHHSKGSAMYDYQGKGGVVGDDYAERERGWKGKRPWDRRDRTE